MKSATVVHGPPGCLAGDTAILYTRDNGDTVCNISLAMLYHKTNETDSRTAWSGARTTQLRSHKGHGVTGYNNVTSIVCTGEKECIRLRLSNGHKLTCTPDHPLLTPTGFVEAGALAVGSVVVGETSAQRETTCGIVGYRVECAVTVLDVTDAGTRTTYDIAMEAPHHNFLASGVFVHNTGKTTYLVSTCNDYLSNGARVCLLSHTKAAAKELTERLDSTKNLHVSTIHSLVYNSIGVDSSCLVTRDKLVAFGNEIGVTISGDFDIYNETDRVIEEGDEIMSIIGRADAKRVDRLSEYERSNRPSTVSTFKYVSDAYDTWKKTNSFIDFTDMLVTYAQQPVPLFYDVLIVDEAQDLSRAQWEVVYELAAFVQHIVVAGDVDQQLFTWGGSDAHGIRLFCDRYNANVCVLPQSYRIPSKVHAVAMDVRERIKDKHDIKYNPRDEEGEVRHYISASDIDFCSIDTLALYRTHALRREIEDALIEKQVPFKVLNGLKGPWDGVFGKTVEAFYCAQKGDKLTPRQQRMLDKYSRVQTIGPQHKWWNVLSFPDRFVDYMIATEGQEPTVRLSTIHGAKGMEADHVVLYTGMTQRVMDGMVVEPDAEHKVFYVGVTRARCTLDIVSGDLNYDI